MYVDLPRHGQHTRMHGCTPCAYTHVHTYYIFTYIDYMHACVSPQLLQVCTQTCLRGGQQQLLHKP